MLLCLPNSIGKNLYSVCNLGQVTYLSDERRLGQLFYHYNKNVTFVQFVTL
jgi:hypothetical protein